MERVVKATREYLCPVAANATSLIFAPERDADAWMRAYGDGETPAAGGYIMRVRTA